MNNGNLLSLASFRQRLRVFHMTKKPIYGVNILDFTSQLWEVLYQKQQEDSLRPLTDANSATTHEHNVFCLGKLFAPCVDKWQNIILVLRNGTRTSPF